MKHIKEKENLIKMSLALGLEPDPKLVKEVAEYKKLMSSVKVGVENLGEVFSEITNAKKNVNLKKIKVEDIPKPPSLEEITFLLEDEKVEKKEVEKVEQLLLSDLPLPPSLDELSEYFNIVDVEPEYNDLIKKASEHISDEVKFEQKSPLVTEEEVSPQSLKELKNKIKYLEQWISRIAAQGPGSGEVNLLRLDDVDTTNIGDNKYLRYNSANAKIEFATVTSNVSGVVSGVISGSNIDLSNVCSNIIPCEDVTYNLGSPDKRWSTLYLAGNTLDLGGTQIKTDSSGGLAVEKASGEVQSVSTLTTTGSIIKSVPFYTKVSGLNTPATNFNFKPNLNDYTFSAFSFADGSGLQRSDPAQFYF